MELTTEEKGMLEGKHGKAVKKSMYMLSKLGEIYGAKKMIDVSSVQIAGVSYSNLGEAGLEYLAELAEDGKVRVLTTLNPAGMDIENWRELGIAEDFAHNQERVIDAFFKMGIVTTCTCTPYLVGNVPHYGEHIAWAESSAVCFSNSVLGARTNREGGPSALASALTGRTPEYGYHLDENRQPVIKVDVKVKMRGTHVFGALGKVLGERNGNKVSYITGIDKASVEELKSFCASIATYGGVALFHMEKITPEAAEMKVPDETITITEEDIQKAINDLNVEGANIDFVSIGCPHCSIKEIARVAELLKGKKVNIEVWVTTARPTKKTADMMGYTKIIEDAGVKFACDTCCVVAPIKGRFNAIATDSAKGCYYGGSRNKFQTAFKSVEEAIELALK
ncbi:MAG: aconitase X catalytic domain-containing protein [Candidatus Hodarchaeales archaeon]|jgi:predicted aconitase